MLISETKKLFNDYLNWLKQETLFKEIGESVEITTPYLDRHNDCLQIYVKKTSENNFVISDGGYIISDLEISGCDLTKRRKEILKVMLSGFGVSEVAGELFVDADNNTFPYKKHSLIQAMLAVNDLFYLSAPYVQNLFIEDVANWFDTNNIIYTPRVTFNGKAGFNHTFDFVIPKSLKINKPERIIKVINTPNKSNIKSFLFSCTDIKNTRGQESVFYPIINDTANDNISSEINDAVNNYGMEPLIWSKRETFKNKLAI